MNSLLLSLCIGIVAGIVDIIPMLKQRLPRYSIAAAFLFFLFISVIIAHCDIPCLPWWSEGGLIALAMMIPVLVHVAATDKKPVPIIIVNTLVLGTLISLASHFLR